MNLRDLIKTMVVKLLQVNKYSKLLTLEAASLRFLGGKKENVHKFQNFKVNSENLKMNCRCNPIWE